MKEFFHAAALSAFFLAPAAQAQEPVDFSPLNNLAEDLAQDPAKDGSPKFAREAAEAAAEVCKLPTDDETMASIRKNMETAWHTKGIYVAFANDNRAYFRRSKIENPSQLEIRNETSVEVINKGLADAIDQVTKTQGTLACATGAQNLITHESLWVGYGLAVKAGLPKRNVVVHDPH
jgi:hypothetical protein